MQQRALADARLSEHDHHGSGAGACLFHEGGKAGAFGLTAV
ncbi:hypothetical protein GCM10027080_36080 [Pedococcus soli]